MANNHAADVTLNVSADTSLFVQQLDQLSKKKVPIEVDLKGFKGDLDIQGAVNHLVESHLGYKDGRRNYNREITEAIQRSVNKVYSEIGDIGSMSLNRILNKDGSGTVQLIVKDIDNVKTAFIDLGDVITQMRSKKMDFDKLFDSKGGSSLAVNIKNAETNVKSFFNTAEKIDSVIRKLSNIGGEDSNMGQALKSLTDFKGANSDLVKAILDGNFMENTQNMRNYQSNAKALVDNVEAIIKAYSDATKITNEYEKATKNLADQSEIDKSYKEKRGIYSEEEYNRLKEMSGIIPNLKNDVQAMVAAMTSGNQTDFLNSFNTFYNHLATGRNDLDKFISGNEASKFIATNVVPPDFKGETLAIVEEVESNLANIQERIANDIIKNTDTTLNGLFNTYRGNFDEFAKNIRETLVNATGVYTENDVQNAQSALINTKSQDSRLKDFEDYIKQYSALSASLKSITKGYEQSDLLSNTLLAANKGDLVNVFSQSEDVQNNLVRFVELLHTGQADESAFKSTTDALVESLVGFSQSIATINASDFNSNLSTAIKESAENLASLKREQNKLNSLSTNSLLKGLNELNPQAAQEFREQIAGLNKELDSIKGRQDAFLSADTVDRKAKSVDILIEKLGKQLAIERQVRDINAEAAKVEMDYDKSRKYLNEDGMYEHYNPADLSDKSAVLYDNLTNAHDRYRASVAELISLERSGTATETQLANARTQLAMTTSELTENQKRFVSSVNAEAKAKKTLLDSISQFTADNEKVINSNELLKRAFEELFNAVESGSMAPTEASRRFQELQRATDGLQNPAKNAANSYEGLFRVLARFGSATYILSMFRRLAQSVKANVLEIDKALGNLEIVTRGQGQSMGEAFDFAAASAEKLGVGISDLIDVQTTFARLGYSSEDAGTLASYTTMLSKVGDIDTSKASDAVTTLTKIFDKGVGDIESVMDELVYVGNNYPITVSDLATGLSNAGSTLSSAGNSLEETIALFAAANAEVQNASQVSTGLRTLSARLRKTTADLNNLGEEMTDAKYNEMLQTLTNANVQITDANGEFRSTYAILKDLASVWDTLDSMTQATITENIAGIRQTNTLMSILHQFQAAEDIVNELSNGSAADTLTNSYDIYLETINGKVARLKATFQDFSYNVLNGGFVGGVIDAANAFMKLANALNGVEIGGAKLSFIRSGILGALVGSAADIQNSQSLFTSGVSGIKNVYDQVGLALVKQQGNFANIKKAIEEYNAAIASGVSAEQAMSSETIMTNSLLQNYIGGLNGSQASMEGFAGSCYTAAAGATAMKIAIAGIVAVVVALVSWLARVAWNNLSPAKIQEAAANARNAVSQLNDELRSNVALISTIKSSWANLASGVNTVTGDNISLSNEDYQQYLDLSNQLAEIAPQLVSYWRADGQAIIDLASDTATLNEQLSELTNNIAQMTSTEISDHMRAIFRGNKDEAAEMRLEYEQLERFVDGIRTGRSTFGQEYADIISKYKINYKAGTDGLFVIDPSIDLSAIDNDIEILKDRYQAAFSDMGEYIAAYLFSNSEAYRNAAPELQAYLQQALAGLDFTQFENFDQFESLLNSLTATLNGENGQKALDLLLSLNGANLSYNDFVAKLNELRSLLAAVMGVDGANLVIDAMMPTGPSFQEVNARSSSGKTKSKLKDSDGIADFMLNSIPQDEMEEFWDWLDSQPAKFAENIGDAYDQWRDQIDKTIQKQENLSDTLNDYGRIEDDVKKLTNAQKELKDEGRLSANTLQDMVSAYGDLDEVVGRYLAGQASGQDVLDAYNAKINESTTNFIMGEMQKALQTATSEGEIEAAWMSLFNMLGVDYSANSAGYNSMLNAIVAANSQCVSILGKQWTSLFSSLSAGLTGALGGLVQLRNKISAMTSNMQTNVAELQVQMATYGNTSNISTSSIISGLKTTLSRIDAQIAEVKTLRDRVSGITVSGGGGGGVGGSGGGGGKGSGGGSGSATDTIHDAYKDLISAYESQIDQLEWEAETAERAFKFDEAAGKWKDAISVYAQMAEASKTEIERAIKAGYSYGDDELDDAMKNYRDACDKIEEIYKDMLDKLLDQYEDYIDTMSDINGFGGQSGYELTLIREQIKYVDDAYKHDLITTEEYTDKKLELLGNYYSAYQDYIDATSEAIGDSIDKEISGLEKRQEELEKQQDAYDVLVETVTDLIDAQQKALEDVNKELERQVKLQEALRDLEEAKRQRTKLIYREGVGYVYEADTEAIKQAQEAYDDLVADYESDKLTENLDKIKDALNNVTSAYEHMKNVGLTSGIMGEDWQERWGEAIKNIIDGSDDADTIIDSLINELGGYTDDYSNIAKDLDEDVEGSITNQISKLEELQDKWSDLSDTLENEASQYEGLLDYIQEFENASYEERIAMLENFSNKASEALEKIREEARETSKAFSLIGADTMSKLFGLVASEPESTGTTNTTTSSGVTTSTPSTSTSSTSTNNWSSRLSGLGTLKKGSKGAAVKTLQEALIAAGYGSYINSSGGADGSFGNGTYNSVLALQRAAGITADGIVGSNTLAKLIKKLTTGSFAAGGVANFTGLAMLHGGKHSELILNNEDAAKLYNYIHTNNDLFSAMLKRNSGSVYRGITGSNQNITVNIGDLYEVNDVNTLANEISIRLPNILSQKLS